MKAAELAKLRPQERLYVACMDMDFSWTDVEVQRVTAWWRNGLPLPEMADRLDRDCDEVAILVMDLRRRGRIEKRDGGVWGGR